MKFDSILIGTIGGIIATVIIYIFKAIYVKIIEPWFENRVYKDSTIEGKWKAFYSINEFQDNIADINNDDSNPNSGGNSKNETIVNLKRAGHKVFGEIINGDDGSIYEFSGSFRNRILTCTYRTQNKSSIDCGSLSLHLEGNGTILKGYTSYYEANENYDGILSSVLTWKKCNK